jgi:hypothetical protein
MTTIDTDHILLQARLDEAASATWTAACAAAAAARSGARLRRMAWSPTSGDAYAYLALARPEPLEAGDLAPVRDALATALPADAAPRVSRLTQAFDVAGASQDAPPAWHYVVEMDPEAGWRDELLRWYDTEHMPGLAAVPGSIRATRLLNHDHGPLSLACYDLIAPDVLGSPPWLAVRHTAWSDIVRPHFTNVRRTMFRTLG